MHEPASSLHPLFDPHSLYNQMRAGIRPEDKMRGYFYWLLAQAKRAGKSPAQQPPEEARSPPDTAALPERQVLSALRVELMVVGVGDSRTESFGDDWIWRHFAPTLNLVREDRGGPTVELSLWDAHGFSGRLFQDRSWCCRAFLIEPEVAQRLRAALASAESVPKRLEPEEAPSAEEMLYRFAPAAMYFAPAPRTGRKPAVERTDVLRRAFAAETVNHNFKVAQILSAVPELEGEWDVRLRQLQFHRLPIPEQCLDFPPRSEPLSVVVVVQAVPYRSDSGAS